jgi:hypothetical protein
LLDSEDERIRLEAAKAILDRHPCRPAIQADISLRGGSADGHLAALIEPARRRAVEPIMLEDVKVGLTTPDATAYRAAEAAAAVGVLPRSR